ncbi:hypothetical protein SRHO_G00136030 [Serrasalmus rhombeus]
MGGFNFRNICQRVLSRRKPGWREHSACFARFGLLSRFSPRLASDISKCQLHRPEMARTGMCHSLSGTKQYDNWQRVALAAHAARFVAFAVGTCHSETAPIRAPSEGSRLRKSATQEPPTAHGFTVDIDPVKL